MATSVTMIIGLNRAMPAGPGEVLPHFKRAEHNERVLTTGTAPVARSTSGDLTTPNRFGPVFVGGWRRPAIRATTISTGRPGGRGYAPGDHRNGERFSAAKAYLTPNPGAPTRGHHGRAHHAGFWWNMAWRWRRIPPGRSAQADQGLARGAAVCRGVAVAAVAHAVGYWPGPTLAAAWRDGGA